MALACTALAQNKEIAPPWKRRTFKQSLTNGLLLSHCITGFNHAEGDSQKNSEKMKRPRSIGQSPSDAAPHQPAHAHSARCYNIWFVLVEMLPLRPLLQKLTLWIVTGCVPKVGTFPSHTIALGLTKPPAEDRPPLMLRSCKTETSSNDGLSNFTGKVFLKEVHNSTSF